MMKYLAMAVLALTTQVLAHDEPMNQSSAFHAPIYQKTIANNPAYQHTLSQSSINPLSQSGSQLVGTGQRFNEQYINRQIAGMVLRQINQSMSVVDDAWVNQLMFDLTAKMNAQVRTQSLFALPIINDTDINAFAVPGGLIGLNTGTITASDNLDEVASVLAHEIAHLSQRHYEHNQDTQKKALLWQLGGLLAGILASSAGGEAAAVAMIGSQTASAETMASHSRDHEREADRVGMQILVQSGYDPTAMPRFFGKLYQQSTLYQAKNAFIPSFVQSHPLTAERLSEATSRANQYQKTTLNQTLKADFDKLVWRIRYVTKQTTLNELTAMPKHSDGARLAYASLLADAGQTEKALTLLNKDKNSTDPLTCITLAHVYTAKKQPAQAVQTLQACQAIYPERRDLKLALAQVYLYDKQPKSALALLIPLVQKVPSDSVAWRLLWQGYQQSAEQASTPQDQQIASMMALQAISHVKLWQGDYVQALQSNAQAQQIAQKYAPMRLGELQKDKQSIEQARDFKP